MDRSIFVPGLPAPQGSKRHVGRGILVESSKRVKPWRATVTAALIEAGWAGQPILTGPVWLYLGFTFPRPKSHYGTGRNADRLKDNAPDWHDKRPDLDKLVRAVMDAVTESGAIRDDGQVAVIRATKQYGPPGVHIHIPQKSPSEDADS